MDVESARCALKLTESPAPIVYLVDDEPDVRDCLQDLFTSVNWRVHAFSHAEGLLNALEPNTGGVALIDIRLPGMSGLELQAQLSASHPSLQIIILTAHRDALAAVEVMKRGAIDVIYKPFSNEMLLNRVREAWRTAERAAEVFRRRRRVRHRFATLSKGERRVVPWLVAGYSTKQIAATLGTTRR